MRRLALVMLVSLVACATAEPSDPCRAAADHVEECTGQTAPAAMPGTCDVEKAEDVLATDCNQLDPSKGDGLWSSFLCALGFTSYCEGGGTQTTRTLTGNVHKVSDKMAEIYEKLKEKSPLRLQWFLEGRDRNELIAVFLGMLELVRLGGISLRQNETFGDIEIGSTGMEVDESRFAMFDS